MPTNGQIRSQSDDQLANEEGIAPPDGVKDFDPQITLELMKGLIEAIVHKATSSGSEELSDQATIPAKVSCLMQHFMELVKVLGATDGGDPVGTVISDPQAAAILRDPYHRQAPNACSSPQERTSSNADTGASAANIPPGENAARERRARSEPLARYVAVGSTCPIDQDELTCSERLLAAVEKLSSCKRQARQRIYAYI